MTDTRTQPTTDVKECPICVRSVPRHTINPLGVQQADGTMEEIWSCPICALAKVNKLHGLNKHTPFGGGKAREIYADAVDHCLRTHQRLNAVTLRIYGKMQRGEA